MAQLIDITGQRFGKLTVIERSKDNRGKKVLWHCMCDCGNDCYKTKDNILKVMSCGCDSKKKNMYIGYKIGRLTVIDYVGSNGVKKYWNCLCSCGNEVIHSSAELNSGKVKSCGCLKLETGEKLKKYNARDRKLYFRWSNIKGRCYNSNDQAYSNYGGRGITMCDEWRDDFFAFRDWSIANGYQEWLSIDRIDNNKGYSPDNCRWTDRKTQCNNRRTNRYITINGITKTMTQWCEERNMNYSQVQRRLAKGWSDYDAIMTPIRPKKPTGQGINYERNHRKDPSN